MIEQSEGIRRIGKLFSIFFAILGIVFGFLVASGGNSMDEISLAFLVSPIGYFLPHCLIRATYWVKAGFIQDNSDQ